MNNLGVVGSAEVVAFWWSIGISFGLKPGFFGWCRVGVFGFVYNCDEDSV